MKAFNKIFGIGLPKTGTTTLNKALNLLGVASLHCVGDFREMIHNTGLYNFPKVRIDQRTKTPIEWKALTNFGEWHWPQLDQTFPGSLFILTLRDIESWLSSCRKGHKTNSPRKGRQSKSALDTFGTRCFNEDRFRWVFEEHQRRVREYFKEREDLLTINIGAQPDWDALCRFLDVPVPDQPFPHENRRYH